MLKHFVWMCIFGASWYCDFNFWTIEAAVMLFIFIY